MRILTDNCGLEASDRDSGNVTAISECRARDRDIDVARQRHRSGVHRGDNTTYSETHTQTRRVRQSKTVRHFTREQARTKTITKRVMGETHLE